jgi:isopenicillin N synthase-like dioxygenase
LPSSQRENDPAAFNEIPLLDFALANDQTTRAKFLESLRRAVVNVGFLYVKNTPVSAVIQETLIKKGIELFELTLEEKLKIEMANSKHFLGYARLGTEITAMKPDYREQFDVSDSYWLLVHGCADIMKFATETPAPGPDEPVWQNLRGPNQVEYEPVTMVT